MPRGSQPSSQAISTDFVAQVKVELILVANANSPAPMINATYTGAGKIALATSARDFPAVCSSGRMPTATTETKVKKTAASNVLNIIARGRSRCGFFISPPSSEINCAPPVEKDNTTQARPKPYQPSGKSFSGDSKFS